MIRPPLYPPDFIGDWRPNVKGTESIFTSTLYQTFELGRFSMYIEERKPKGDIEEIKGKIYDRYGEASFRGAINKKHIMFTKEYSQNAIAAGGHMHPIPHIGQSQDGQLYRGTYTLLYYTHDGKQEGEFVLKAYHDVRNN